MFLRWSRVFLEHNYEYKRGLVCIGCTLLRTLQSTQRLLNPTILETFEMTNVVYLIKIIFQPILSCIYVMFLSFYTFIILIVQVINSVVVNDNYHRFLEPLRNKDTLPRIRRNVRKEAENKRANTLSDELKLFNYVEETDDDSSGKYSASEEETLCELKSVLKRLLKKLDCLAKKSRCGTSTTASTLDFPQKKRDENNAAKRSRWGQWTAWSACSVSCGRGRVIRWRHCLEQCDLAETEMEEKTCQLPACGPGKFLGIKL